jgi:beta-lactamase class A
MFLRRYYALFFIVHGSRRVWLGGCTANPTGAWVTQQARNLGLHFSDQRIRFLIRDRDSKYSGPFDEVFQSEGLRIVKTPVRSPKANAIAERFVRTVRAECLDWLLILNRRHLERVLRVYTDHYNRERPHRALRLQAPEHDERHESSPMGEIKRRDRIGGLIHEYYRARRLSRDTNNGALHHRSAPSRIASARVPGVWVLPAAEAVGVAAQRESARLDERLARNARSFPGISVVWYQDLRTGASASWNADAVFPAASTVKLGLLVAGLDRYGVHSPVAYDVQAMATWSSNLAANRLLAKVGGPAAAQAPLARVGATHSTFTGAYRVGTALTGAVEQPPRISSRVTTARDLAKILYTLHAGVLGRPRALARLHLSQRESRLALGLLLSSEPRGNNVGLLRPALGATPAAQKHGWLSVARHTAAIVLYGRHGPKILVVLTYAPDLTQPTAQAYGRSLVRLLRLR